MSVDEVIKELNLLTKLCGTETAVPFLVMTGNRLCEDHQDYEMEHNPDTCYADCPRTISQNFTRGLKKKEQEGQIKFKFFQAHKFEGSNSFSDAVHLRPECFKRSIQKAIELKFEVPKLNRKGDGAKRRRAHKYFSFERGKHISWC